MAYRTRSKRPLRDVRLGRLEAELRAPDITPDMYDSNSAPEDKDWTDWLRGLMSTDMDNEGEGQVSVGQVTVSGTDQVFVP